MLSCASSDGRVRISQREIDTPNEIGHRVGTGISDDGVLTENAALARYAVGMDADMHWEMNYHEAAIFLEVRIAIFFIIPINELKLIQILQIENTFCVYRKEEIMKNLTPTLDIRRIYRRTFWCITVGITALTC